jgi:ABC-2 type transport system permease protein
MNKIWLIVKREFLNRVQKKSFLIATIMIPLIFPTIIGLLVYVMKEQDRNAKKEVILYVDDSDTFVADSSRFIYKKFPGSLGDAEATFTKSDTFGLLYIPRYEISKPVTVTLRTKVSVSMDDESNIKSVFENRIKELKMRSLNIDQKFLDDLHTDVHVDTIIDKAGPSNSMVLSSVGTVCGILMYMFIFIYGAQIMQGVIEEKMSKVVEVIISSVKPFQLMMGKIIGLGTVSLLQFVIWIVLMLSLTSIVFVYFGIDPQHQHAMEQLSHDAATQQAVMGPQMSGLISAFSSLPFGKILICFLFYFISGYLLYGALFAAVGSSVDSPAEAQQFMFPITIPMLISYMSLFMVILQKPHSAVSFWLSIIPFTSPIAMMGRIAFGVPPWELALSMLLLIAGFILTTWIAGRIYRVGILMHGTRVNYKVLAKWFMMKN